MNQNHCYQIKNVWYFRKKITYTKNNEVYLFRLSIKKLLGKKLYYSLLSKSMLFNFVAYLNNKIEDHIRRNNILSQEEIIQFIQTLLMRYKEKATINEVENSSFIDNFGSDSSKIEDMRFKALSYFDDNGEEVAGHTPKALDKEIQKIFQAHNNGRKSSLANRAKDILARQNIISEEEYENIPDEHLKQFREALLKIELSVLMQDKKNYEHNTPYFPEKEVNTQNTAQVIEPTTKTESINLTQKINSEDNWDSIMASYLSLKESEGCKPNTLRSTKIDIRLFKNLLLGDQNFHINTKRILDITLEDILFLKEQIKNSPSLTQKSMRDYYNPVTKEYTQSIYYLIDKAKTDNLRIISLGGMNAKVKAIKSFILFLHTTNPAYRELNTSLWDKLSVSQKILTSTQKEVQVALKKLPLLSKDLNAFLIQKYPNTIQGKKNFNLHTEKQAHIFFGFVLNMYTGARAEEIAQLKVSDFSKKIVEDKIIYYFKIKITDFDKQSLKNINSVRVVPIHDNIIRLGFLNYLQSRIDTNHEWLFSLHLNSDGKRKQFARGWNTAFKKWFTNTYPNLIGSPPTFHSLRDHFITKFLQKEDGDIRFSLVNQKKLVGHGAKDIAIDSYYKEDIDLEFAYTLINDIDFKLDEAQLVLEKLVAENIAKPILDIKL